MKRVWLIFAAALLVLLSYPLTSSHAGQQLDSSKPCIVTPPDGGGIPDAYSGDNGDGDGDADDIGSYKLRGDSNLGAAGSSVSDTGFRLFLRVWWSFMVLLR